MRTLKYATKVLLSPVGTHTGDKVEFNAVDFVESRFGPVHTGDKVDRTFDIQTTKSTELATMSTATSCRIQIVAYMSLKPATKSTASATVDFVADLSPVSATVDSV